jgi:3-dehydroquinate dehydratase-2
LGKREPGIYGSSDFESFLANLRSKYPDITILYYQSNVEGEIINAIQEHGFSADGIILNPGGYTHTSVAIGDAIAAIKTAVIEVHISNVHAREEFRKLSHVSAKARGTICGLGLDGYDLAIQFFLNHKG